MAIYLQGLTVEETRALTRVMIGSGEQWTWPADGGPIADKHSTGGVGDKTSLVLAPLLAACGLRVPMVSGRGLGHTGGTLDKLEALPGYRTELSKADFDRLLGSVGYAMGGATDTLDPLDRELYALRDVTGTVESIPLITASILSKKVAAGVGALVLDVKWGDGAFMRTREQAEVLARALIQGGREFGVKTAVLLTDMNAPLGRRVGHSLELREAIAMLDGEPAEARFATVVIELACRLLRLAGVAADADAARAQVERALASGAARERFLANVEAQGGDAGVAADPAGLPTAPVRRTLAAPGRGWLTALPARAVGHALIDLGGGRRQKGDRIDHAVGFEFVRVVGEACEAGEPWCVIHARTEADAAAVAAVLEDIAVWAEEPVEQPPVLTAALD